MALKQSGNWIHRHNYNVRICHWINVICFMYLLLSGIMMFLQFPELYWGDVGFRGYEAIFKLSNWGLTWEEADALGNRQWGRNYHFLFAWVFLFNNLIYVGWNLRNRHFSKRMWPRGDELHKDNLKEELNQHLHLRAAKGDAAKKYNVFQKLSYLIVIFCVVPFYGHQRGRTDAGFHRNLTRVNRSIWWATERSNVACNFHFITCAVCCYPRVRSFRCWSHQSHKGDDYWKILSAD